MLFRSDKLVSALPGETASIVLPSGEKHKDLDQPLPVRGIAETYGISERFLIQVMLQLKAAGLVYSTRGPSGGYRLARPPDQISLREIFDAIEGPELPVREARGPAGRVLATVLNQAQAAERALLEQTSIAQLADQMSELNWVI